MASDGRRHADIGNNLHAWQLSSPLTSCDMPQYQLAMLESSPSEVAQCSADQDKGQQICVSCPLLAAQHLILLILSSCKLCRQEGTTNSHTSAAVPGGVTGVTAAAHMATSQQQLQKPCTAAHGITYSAIKSATDHAWSTPRVLLTATALWNWSVNIRYRSSPELVKLQHIHTHTM